MSGLLVHNINTYCRDYSCHTLIILNLLYIHWHEGESKDLNLKIYPNKRLRSMAINVGFRWVDIHLPFIKEWCV